MSASSTWKAIQSQRSSKRAMCAGRGLKSAPKPSMTFGAAPPGCGGGGADDVDSEGGCGFCAPSPSPYPRLWAARRAAGDWNADGSDASHAGVELRRRAIAAHIILHHWAIWLLPPQRARCTGTLRTSPRADSWHDGSSHSEACTPLEAPKPLNLSGVRPPFSRPVDTGSAVWERCVFAG